MAKDIDTAETESVSAKQGWQRPEVLAAGSISEETEGNGTAGFDFASEQS